MKLASLTRLAVLVAPLSGCSLLVGPNGYSDVYSASSREIVSAGTDVWTNFDQQSLDAIKTRLNGASELYRKRALNLTRTRDSGGDLVATSVVGGAIAGATGSVDGARIGTGLAGILGFGVDRYKLDVQRTNLVAAAAAYDCVSDSLNGLKEEDLSIEIRATDPAEAKKLNDTRRDAKALVGKTAKAIRYAFEDAQASVTLKQPDLASLQQSMKQQQENSQPKTDVSGKAFPSTGANNQAESLAPQLESIGKEIRDLSARIAEKNVVIDWLSKKPEMKEQLAATTKERDDLVKQVEKSRAKVLQYLEQQSGGVEVSEPYMKDLAVRIGTLEAKLAGCRALMSK